MIRIVLSDDHPLIRTGLKELINSQPNCEVVAEAENGDDVVELVQSKKPDILITDLTMPGLPVIDVIRQLRRAKTPVKVIVLSMHSEAEYVQETIGAGADAYVTKDAPSDQLLSAITEVNAGRNYLSAGVSHTVVTSLKSGKLAKDQSLAITPREKQVLALAAEGNSSAEIATKLRISPRTAETHRANLMRKLGLHSQTDLVHFAFRSGLIAVPKPM